MTFEISNFKFQIAGFVTQNSKLKTQNGFAVAFLATMMLLCGCGKKTEPAAPPTDGRMRIVSLAPNLTEILFALGLDAEIVGVTRHCNAPAAALTKRQIGTFWQPDIEAIVALRPTLVVAETFEQHRRLAEQLAQSGCRTLSVQIESVAQLFDGIVSMGQAVGRPSQAQQLVERLRAAIQTLQRRTEGRAKPKVLWVIQRQPLRVAGTQTFVNELIEIAGGVNAIGKTLHAYPPIGDEEVIAAWPDVIIEPTDQPEQRQAQQRSALSFYAAFRTLPAVRNGRIYVIDGDLVSRLGPRIEQGLKTIAACLEERSL